MENWFARSAWLWAEASRPQTPAGLAAFAARNAVRDVWLSVPETGPTRATVAHARALAGVGIRVSCLGGDPAWATDAASAAAWTARAVSSRLFTGVHLDIEPWTRTDWGPAADDLLLGLARAIAAVKSAAGGLEVEVDVPGWLARRHPDGVGAVVRAADRLTVMAFRDTADAIIAEADAAVVTAAMGAIPFRVAVDAVPSPRAGTTFHDIGADALARHAAVVARAFARLPGFGGIAVHDLAAWRELRP